MLNGDANFLKPSQQLKGLNSGPSPDGSGHPHFSMLNRDANFLKPSQQRKGLNSDPNPDGSRHPHF